MLITRKPEGDINMSKDDFNQDRLDNIEDRLRRLEDSFLELSTQLELIIKLGRVAVAILAATLGFEAGVDDLM